MTEEMTQALNAAKEQFEPMVGLADWIVEALANSTIPNNVAKFIGNLSKELENNGFNREETIKILTAPSLDITGLLKQETAK